MLRRVRAAWPFDTLDLMFFGGLGILTLSIAVRDLVLAGIVLGVVLMAYAFIAALPPRSAG